MRKPFERSVATLTASTIASGVRVTENMRKQLSQMALAGVTVPSLYHYVKYVLLLTGFKKFRLTKL